MPWTNGWWFVTRSPHGSPAFRFREQAVFAWIPSLTSVSRQAAFAGKAPIFFPNSIQTTDKEPALVGAVLGRSGLHAKRGRVHQGAGRRQSGRRFRERFLIPRQGSPGWSWTRSTRSCTGWKWAPPGCTTRCASGPSKPYLNTLLDLLLDRGFRVYLTSDHGNIEAEGCGRPAEGAVADLRGERVRIYPDAGPSRQGEGTLSSRAGMGARLVCRRTTSPSWLLLGRRLSKRSSAP